MRSMRRRHPATIVENPKIFLKVCSHLRMRSHLPIVMVNHRLMQNIVRFQPMFIFDGFGQFEANPRSVRWRVCYLFFHPEEKNTKKKVKTKLKIKTSRKCVWPINTVERTLGERGNVTFELCRCVTSLGQSTNQPNRWKSTVRRQQNNNKKKTTFHLFFVFS